MNEQTETEDRFDPIADISRITMRLYRKGSLPIYFLFAMILYNLIFFVYGNGKELYLVLPIASFVFLVLMNYWNDRGTRWKILLSIIFLLISAGLDLLVSITYYIGSGSTRSIPTAILDILAIITFLGWLLNIKTEESNTNYSTENQSEQRTLKSASSQSEK